MSVATLRLLRLLLATLPFAACAETNRGADLLFADNESRLAMVDQLAVAAIFSEMFPQSADGQRFEHPDCGDVMPDAHVTDLNSDSNYEVFVAWGNTCTSGNSGRSLTLFTRNGGGQWESQFGFPALGWTILESSSEGWPDLRFGGPGFCHPVWTWRSGGYIFRCSSPEDPGGCGTRKNVCPAE